MRNSSKKSVSRYRVFLLHENVISENVSDIYSASTRITQRDFFYFKQTTEIAVYRELVCSSLNKQAKILEEKFSSVEIASQCEQTSFRACHVLRSNFRHAAAIEVVTVGKWRLQSRELKGNAFS